MRLVNHHYDMNRVNWVFLIGAVLLLATWVWAAWDDYTKPYKEWQRSFYDVYETQLRLEESELWTSEREQQLRELQQRRAELEQQINVQDEEVRRLEQELQHLEEIEIPRQEDRASAASRRYAPVEYRYQQEQVRAANNPDYEVPDQLEQRFQRLRSEMRQEDRRLQEMEEEATSLRQELEDQRSEITELEAELQQLTQERETIRATLSDVEDSWVNLVLEAPLINFINPRTEVEQIQVDGLYMDYNFDLVPRQDFCQSCHMGIDNPSFQLDDDGTFEQTSTQEAFAQQFPNEERREVMKNVFKTHPNFEVIGATQGDFPFSEYGCTSCHMGDGRALDFTRAAHTPSSEEEREEWEERYDWEPREFWEWPMLQTRYLDASIPQFYEREHVMDVPHADRVNRGHEAWINYGCNNCHSVDGLNYQRKIGFTLENIGSKLDRSWTKRWIERPSDFNENARMPQIFHRYNLDDSEEREKSTAIIHSITEYLYHQSEDLNLEPPPDERGDAERGRRLFMETGCAGCHSMQAQGIETSNSAPDLSHIGSKVDRRWLYNWLQNPRDLWEETHMPDMRLTDQEANDITEWLLQQEHPDWSADQFPAELSGDSDMEALLDERVEELARDFIGRLEGPRTTQRRIEEMRAEAQEQGIEERKRLARFVGSRAVDYFGCSSCHMIDGHEGYNRIGPDLDGIGSKNLHMLAFGFVDIPHTRQHFVEQKLSQPGLFDKGQVNDYLENLRMPRPNLNDRQLQDLVTFVMSLRDERLVGEERIHQAGPGQKFANEAHQLMSEFNCQGCHQVDGQAPMVGFLQDYYQEKLDDGEELQVAGERVRSADQMAHFQTAPSLTNVGRRLDRDWMFDFLKEPDGPGGREKIRTWQHLTMPQFHFSDEQASTISRGLTYESWGELPSRISEQNMVPTAESVEVGRYLFDQQCALCHLAEGEDEFHTPQMTPNLNYIGNKFSYRGFMDWAGSPDDFVPDGVQTYRHRGMVGFSQMDLTEDRLGFEPEGEYDTREQQLKALRDYLFHYRLGIREEE